MLSLSPLMCTGMEDKSVKQYEKYFFHLLDFVLGDNCSSLIVQQLQLFLAELSLVSIATNSRFMAGEQTCETFLSSKRGGCVFTVSSNPCTWRQALNLRSEYIQQYSKARKVVYCDIVNKPE